MKKVVFLSRYQGVVDRGVETYVAELSSRLKSDFEVEVLSGESSDSFKRLQLREIDVVIPTNGRLQALKASIGRITRRYKMIISGQAGIGRDDLWNLLVCRPDVYVALTESEKQWSRKWAYASKIVKIPNGVDLKTFNPMGLMAKLNLPRPIVLSVGALEWYKNHELTIKAVAKLDNVSLLIIGKGQLKDKLNKFGRELLGPKRFAIQEVDHQNIAPFYRAADVFVMPSWVRESFGIVYLEALATGVPVVATNDLSRKEIIGEAGILVSVLDDDHLSLAIQAALERDWGNAPRLQAEKFSWDFVALEYKQLFENLMSK